MTRSDVKNPRPKTIFRRILSYLLLVLLLWVFYIAAGRALCYIAMRQIAGLTNTKIRTESVAFHSDGSVYIKNFTISPYEEQAGDDTILSAENVYARFNLRSFLGRYLPRCQYPQSRYHNQQDQLSHAFLLI